MTSEPDTNKNSNAKLSLESLAKSYQRPLHRYFLRQGLSVSDANDCVQDVFSRLVRKGGIDGVDNPQGYIFTIANNILRDRNRRRRTSSADRHDNLEDILLQCSQPSQDRVISGQQSLALVKSAILDMPPNVKKVFILSRFEGLKYREIAQVTGMSMSAVEKHMMTALRRLSELRDKL